MITRDHKRLLSKLNEFTARSLETAAGFSIARNHHEVTLEHLLAKVLEDGTGDIPQILQHFGVNAGDVWDAVLADIEKFRDGNSGRPTFSPMLFQAIEDAWLVGSVHHDDSEIRTGYILEALLENDSLRSAEFMTKLTTVNRDDLRRDFFEIVAASNESKASLRAGGVRSDQKKQTGKETALDLYTTDITGQASSGAIDPVFGRDGEIRQMIDILSRRRKNNPILVGEAGVGKTAVVEGFALRLVSGDVPDSLKEVEIRGLDLGLLQAGAGVKGEFENRLKSVIQEVREAPVPTILFIDEAHTLIGAGGAAGTADAANMLKPALARGELRTIAATTWSEYKKYIEKDPALARRFQMVKIEEPSADEAAIMLRGLKSKYEDHHKVQITDAAIDAVAHLSDRYITGRQLPDKAVDLLDTASARVKMTQSSKPGPLDDIERRLLSLQIQISSVDRDLRTGLRSDQEELERLVQLREEVEAEKAIVEKRWHEERKLALQVEDLRSRITVALLPAEDPQNGSDVSVDALREELAAAQEAVALVRKDETPLVHAEVNEDIIAGVVADWTGIPVGNMVRDELTTLLQLEDQFRNTIRGQDEALGEFAESIRSAKAGMGNPDAPIGVFLFVGPSGVGKTETARTLAQLLFGGERFLITINMSEYQEAHSVSQLKGSPPGYVGYGEGGVLTEAVRQRPYSVVLLDEVEKAHPDVMQLFFQVFDRGFMRDGEGREIDFKNTIILLTSNVGSDVYLQLCENGARPEPEQLRNAIHHDLVSHFQAALLARMKVVPFYPLQKDAMTAITRLKLGKIDRRLKETHGVSFNFSEEVVGRIVDRCTQVDSGARNIDFIIDRTVLPNASRALLTQLVDGELEGALTLGLDSDGSFTYTFGDVEDGAGHTAIGNTVAGQSEVTDAVEVGPQSTE